MPLNVDSVRRLFNESSEEYSDDQTQTVLVGMIAGGDPESPDELVRSVRQVAAALDPVNAAD